MEPDSAARPVTIADSRRIAMWLALSYFVLACAWIYFSDQLVFHFVQNPDLRHAWHTTKGLTFVCITAPMLYGLVARALHRVVHSETLALARERQLRAIMDSDPDCLLVLRPDGTIHEVNPAGLALMGVSDAGSVLGSPLATYLAEPYRAQLHEVLTLAADGRPQSMEFQTVSDLGGRWIAFRAVPLRSEAAMTLVLGAAREITDHKQALAKIDRLNRLYSVLSDINQVIVRTRDRDELFQAVCRALVELGRFRMVWIGHVNTITCQVDPVCHWGHEEGYLRQLRINLDQDERAQGPTGRAVLEGERLVCHDIGTDARMGPWRDEALRRGYRSSAALPVRERESVRWVLNIYASEEKFFDTLHLDLLDALADDISFALSVIHQEQQRRQAELALAEEKERLVVTLRSIGDGVITTDTGGHVVLMNGIAEQLTGWKQDEACGRPLHEIFRTVNPKTGEPLPNPVQQVLKLNAAVELGQNTTLLSRDGHERLIADTGAPIRNADGAIIGVVLVVRDVTEKLKLEDELLKTRKLESLGVLAGGIAHDFNNLLTAILGSISLARAFVAEDGKVQVRLAEAEKACLQARELTQQLLTFARGGAPVKSAASIADLVAGTVGFATVGGRIRSRLELPETLWTVEVDTGQISQVLNNLIINAAQAMPDGGTVTVSAENVVVGAHLPLPLAPGPYVRIEVSDEGVGIPPENLPRIFDPYFTTKAEGSGLGLASAYAIIKKHDGYIDVRSTPGAGTAFTVYLPAAINEKRDKPPVDDKVTSGRGAVLVMDDAKSIRELIGEMLDYLGYRAAFARDGEEARQAYAQALANGERFDAVIMDLTIPGGMGGKEAVGQILELDPEAKVIVSSGYSNDPIMSNYRQHGFAAVIAKPYRLAELGRVLDGVLSGQGSR